MSDNRYTILNTDHIRSVRLLLWLAVLCGGLYIYFFRDEWLRQEVVGASHAPRFWLSVIYLALGCIRGFTLVPATYLVIVGLLVLPPMLLYLLTIFGIIVSSASVYYFAEWIELDRFFERHYPRQLAKLRALMARHELPIVITWSFFPLAPTDLVCYVCGALKVDLKKCLLGVVIGEGTICAIYIFLGGHTLRWFTTP